jgi:hypothetical protein
MKEDNMTISIKKASLWRRFSAWLFDIILTITIAVGFASATSAIVKYDSYVEKMDALKQQYAEEYGIDLDIPKKNTTHCPLKRWKFMIKPTRLFVRIPKRKN